ncbi:MAG: hypothetical protein WD894_11800 [Pirellulales bacterium]
MTPSDPKLLLASAETATERKHAVKNAMAVGMPLYEIEEFLDWADAVRTGNVPEPARDDRTLLYNLIRGCQKDPRTE